MDFTEHTDEDLAALRDAVNVEYARRQTLAAAPGLIDAATRQYLAAEGLAEGAAWRQPTGAHDAYPEGWTVAHDGKEWASLLPGNVWEPGVSGWREVTEGPPVWVRPTGAHDAYQTGDRVLFDGVVYVSLIDGNVWSPTEHPAGWDEEDV